MHRITRHVAGKEKEDSGRTRGPRFLSCYNDFLVNFVYLRCPRKNIVQTNMNHSDQLINFVHNKVNTTLLLSLLPTSSCSPLKRSSYTLAAKRQHDAPAPPSVNSQRQLRVRVPSSVDPVNSGVTTTTLSLVSPTLPLRLMRRIPSFRKCTAFRYCRARSSSRWWRKWWKRWWRCRLLPPKRR